MGGSQVRTAVTLVVCVLGAWAAAACAGDDDAAPTTTRSVTLTTSPEADPAALGEQILVTAGVRDAVVPGEGAEERLAELGAAWCTTALRSDVENADATFRYSLNEFFTEWGLVAADGEVQDVPLAKAMLAATHAEALARASDELLCPEVALPGA